MCHAFCISWETVEVTLPTTMYKYMVYLYPFKDVISSDFSGAKESG